MRVVAAHHVADHLRALAVLGVGRQVLLPHRVEDAALHRLQAVADVGQRARGDDRERVVEIPRLRRLVQRDVVGRAGAAAAARQERRADGRVAAALSRPPSAVDVVEERLVGGFRRFAKCVGICTGQATGRGAWPRRAARPNRPDTLNPTLNPSDLLDEQHLPVRRQRPGLVRHDHLELRRRVSRSASIAGMTTSRKCFACFSADAAPSCVERLRELVGPPLELVDRAWSACRASSCPRPTCRPPPSPPPRSAPPASGTRRPPAGCSGSPSAPSAGPRC